MNIELKTFLDLDHFIQSRSPEYYEYHKRHIKLAQKYMLNLNRKMDLHLNERKLSIIALAHDLFKEQGLDSTKEGLIKWNGLNIPQDNNRYVRTNLDVLEEFDLDDYFNTSIQLHPLSAGIFFYNELGIKDPEILYPIMFHSCPIMHVYKRLGFRIQQMIDLMILSDKLSSNYLRINFRHVEVRIDLDLVTFGPSGKELNYSLGLYLARLIGQGDDKEKEGLKSLDYYYQRLCKVNPLIVNNPSIKKLGGNKIWPERKSQLLMMP